MPGIIGILDPSGKTDLESLIYRMCKSVKHEKWYIEDKYIDKDIALARISLGIFNPEKQPIFNNDKSLCIMMEGEIYNYENCKHDLVEKGYSFSINNDPEVILYLYEEYGEDFVSKLNGSFIIAIWHVNEQRLIIANDRYSLRPLYYALSGNKLLFASEIKAILEDEAFDKRINDIAMMEFLTFGYPLEEKTLFRNINFLTGGSILIYSKGRVSLRRYWDFSYADNCRDYSEKYYIENLSDCLVEAVRRQLQGNHRIGVFLSGGLDSRTIVASIDRKYYPVHTITFGEKGCDDEKFARLVADKLGTIHHFYPLSPLFIIDFIEKGSWLSDGMESPWDIHGISTLGDIRLYCDVMLNGFAGDLILGGSYLTNDILLANEEAELLQAIYRRMRGAFTNELMSFLFKKDYYSRMKGIAFESLKQILQMYKDKKFANRSDHFFLRNRVARNTVLGLGLTRTQLECRTPFFDNDFIDFLLTIPPGLRRDHYLYIKVFSKLFPHLVDIPWQETGLPINASRFQEWLFHERRKIREKFYRGLGRMFNINPSSRNSRPWANYSYWLRNCKKLQDFVYQILVNEGVGIRRYFDPKAVESILLKHFTGEENNKDIIGRLLSFELWYRFFVEKSCRPH